MGLNFEYRKRKEFYGLLKNVSLLFHYIKFQFSIYVK